MKRLVYFLILAGLILLACKKETFPDEFSVNGKWWEKIADTNKTEIEFQKQNNLKLRLRSDTIRDYKYLLDKPDELQIFDLAEFPDGKRTTYKVTYDSKTEQMTIFSLYPASGGVESQTVFVRK
ncbi:MAG TPA: hypothetical protein VK172_03765 [Lentimicrobium sp.]|nr:hypothetical protein [Lentimicrobium sp.]